MLIALPLLLVCGNVGGMEASELHESSLNGPSAAKTISSLNSFKTEPTVAKKIGYTSSSMAFLACGIKFCGLTRADSVWI